MTVTENVHEKLAISRCLVNTVNIDSSTLCFRPHSLFRVPDTLRVNRAVEGVDEDSTWLRPDLVVRDVANRRITIVDLTVPFENQNVAFDVRTEKLEKYSGLAESLKRQNYKVIVDAFLIGALSGLDPADEQTIRFLNINRRYAVTHDERDYTMVPEHLYRACIGCEAVLELHT